LKNWKIRFLHKKASAKLAWSSELPFWLLLQIQKSVVASARQIFSRAGDGQLAALHAFGGNHFIGELLISPALPPELTKLLNAPA
jgi:hypothetical protein